MSARLYRALLSAVLCVPFLLPALPQQAHAQDTLRIATFNCHFLTRPRVHIKFGLRFNMDENADSLQAIWAQPGFRDTLFNVAAETVAGVLAQLNADVLTLTEVGDSTDVAELRAELDTLGAVYPFMAVGQSRDTFTRQNVAVLSRFPIIDVLPQLPGREGYLPEPDDPETEDDTGISKGMRATIAAFGQAFHVYVIHLISESRGYEQDMQRVAQASLVRRHYMPDLKAGAHIIVAGDFNDDRGEPALHRIRGFDDIEPDLIQTGLIDYFPRDDWDERWTYEFQGVRRQIDHILLSRSIRDATLDIESYTIDHNNTLASDHRPLMVMLRLRNTP